MSTNTIRTRIQLRTDTLANWTAHDDDVLIYKGEAALALDTANNKYILKIGTNVNGSYWKDLTENLTIPASNIQNLATAVNASEYQWQLEEVNKAPGTFKLQRKTPTDESWTDISTISLSFTGTYNKTTNPIALKDYVDTAVSGATTDYYEGIRGSGETDMQVIQRVLQSLNVVNVKGGSTFVIKTPIYTKSGTTTYEYIAFTYNTNRDFFPESAQEDQSITGIWMAMDGNYDADNVYFKTEFDLAGDWTQVGNIKLSSSKYNAIGKNLTTVMSDIFDKTVQPQLGTAAADIPKLSVTLTGSGTKEVGTEFTPSYTVTYTQGKYLNPWNNTKSDDGTTVTAYSVTDTNSGSSTSGSSSFTKFTVADDTNYKVSATVTYSNGTIAKDNKGNDSNPVVQRSGSTISATSGAVVGGRYTFYGSTTTANPTINSALIRSLTGKTFANLSNTELSFPDDTKCVIIAIPQTRCSKDYLEHIYDVNDSSSEINDAFVKQEVNVEGYNGATAVTYSVYVLNRPAGLVANKYKITQ